MTSGNVPLEKTIKRQVCTGRLAETRRKSQLTHYLATSTIADDNKFPTNFSHVVKGTRLSVYEGQGRSGCSGCGYE